MPELEFCVVIRWRFLEMSSKDQRINHVFTRKRILEKIEKHKSVVFKISKIYMDNKDSQNDLYQEIIYQAWKSYGDFQKRSDFFTWLYRTALSTAIVFLRSEKKRNFIQKHNVEGLSARQEPYNNTDDMNMKRVDRFYYQVLDVLYVRKIY